MREENDSCLSSGHDLLTERFGGHFAKMTLYEEGDQDDRGTLKQQHHLQSPFCLIAGGSTC
jgi:hypothetical protein